MIHETVEKVVVAIAAKLPRQAVLGLMLAFVVAGCAKPPVKQDAVFFPGPPDPPRIQFLTALNTSSDLVPKKDSFLLVVTGGEEAEKEIVIRKPYGVTAHKGKVYVCDLAGKVVMIDPENKLFEPLKGGGLGVLKKPVNVAFDNDDNMYVVDSERKKVFKFGPAGEFLRDFTEGVVRPSDVVTDADTVYILDFGSSEIKMFDRKTGEPKGAIGKATDTAEGLTAPTSFALDDKGIFYVTNIVGNNIIVLDRDGHVLRSFGKIGEGFGEFRRPKGIAVDEQGHIFAVDAGHQNVQIFNDTGRLLLFFGDPGLVRGSLNLPVGIVVTKETVPFFSKFADPSFEVENVIFVTNQFGDAKLSVYGLGHRKGENPDKSGEEKAKPAEQKEKEKPAEQKEKGTTN